jgi:glycerol-3-phosphate acyltransferase PlsX
MPTIAIDAHSGETGPTPAVRAAALISNTTSIDVLVVGQANPIEAALGRCSYNPERLRIRGIENVADSLEETVNRVVSGEADAMVTASESTQTHRICGRLLRRVEGLGHSPMAAVVPTAPRPGNRDPFALILDVGGEPDCTVDDLVAWARMGTAYASRISKVEAPTVGLLSTSSESNEGPSDVVAANKVLSADPHLRFVGNIQGVDIPQGAADVVVCDGFSGHLIVGLLGGIGDALMEAARGAWTQRPTWRLGLRLLGGAVMHFKELTEHESYGGAPLLGYDRIVICALPLSGSEALANAIKLAAKAHREDVVAAVTQSLDVAR